MEAKFKRELAMRIWVYVLAAVMIIAGVAGLTTDAGLATVMGEILFAALLASVISAAIKALVRRFATRTKPGSQSPERFPEQRV